MIRTVDIDARVKAEVAQQRYPLVFVSISGAYLYGFPSPDSDFDVRGVHLLPAREVVGLSTGPDTIEVPKVVDGLQTDLKTDDLEDAFLRITVSEFPVVCDALHDLLVRLRLSYLGT